MMDVMDSKTTRTAAVLLCCLAAIVLGVNFDWTGEALPHNHWNAEDNWYGGPYCYPSPYCYPRTTDDDAIVDEVVAIDLTVEEEEIDDLTITGRGVCEPTTFSGQDYERTLDCDTITFTDTLVRVIRKGRLEARGTEPCPEET